MFNTRKKKLMQHLKEDHLSSSNFFKCKIYNCQRLYSSIRSFEKHLARWHPDCNFESFLILLIYSLSKKPEASSINETKNKDISDSCLSFDRIKLSDESSIAKNMMYFCLKLQEKYILPHSTYISIMEEIITLFSEFHHLVLTNAQNQFNQNNQFYNESDLLEKNCLTKIWD